MRRVKKWLVQDLYLNGDVVTVVAARPSLSVTARRLLVAKCAREGTLVSSHAFFKLEAIALFKHVDDKGARRTPA